MLLPSAPVRRLAPSLLAAWLVLLLAGLAAPALAADLVDLSSPRATMRSFLEAMNDAKEGRAARLHDAGRTLDLSDVTAALRPEVGAARARDLLEVIDKTEQVRLERIPLQPKGDRWLFSRTAAGEVAIARVTLPAGDDPKAEPARDVWLFDRQTVARLPDMVRAVAGKDYVRIRDGRGGGGFRDASDWVRDRVPPTLRSYVFLGFEAWQWLGIAALVVLGWLVGRLFGAVLWRGARGVARRRNLTIDDAVLREMARPVTWAGHAVVWLGLSRLLKLPVESGAWILVVAKVVLVVAGARVLYRVVGVGADGLKSVVADTESRLDDLLLPLATRALQIFIVAMAGLTLAQTFGFEVTGVIATLGLGGLAFALAAKDTVENLFGSLTVLLDKPFEVGDVITLGSTTGTVERVGFRSTRIRTAYNSLVTLPNSKLISSEVDNLGKRHKRRFNPQLGLTYQTTPAQIEAFCAGIRELAASHPLVEDGFICHFVDMGESALTVQVQGHFLTTDWPEELRTRQELLLSIVKLADALGVEFAYPTRTLVQAGPGSGSAPGKLGDGDPAEVGRQRAAEVRCFEPKAVPAADGADATG